MKSGTLLKAGITCSCVSIVCCVTPILVVLLGTLGLSAAVGYLDYVLLPALAASLGVTGYALVKRRRQRDAA